MSLTSLLQGSPEHYSITGDESHLTVKGSPGFVVEFNTYNITEVNSHITYLSLAGITSQWAGGGFDDFLNLMNFLVFLIL